jgi:NitT/TauT family transport system substrate-binding protein
MLKHLALTLALAAAALGNAQAQTLESVKFAWNPNPQTAQIDVAIKNGLFKQAGLDVRVIAFPTGREALEALMGGQVDFAYMAEFPVATAVLRQQKLKIIADLSRYRGQRVISSAKTLDLKSVNDLVGKKLGTTLGTNVEFFTYRLLAQIGAKPTIINAGPADLLPAVVRGDIDAAIMFPTFFGAAKKTLGDAYRELISDLYVLHMVITASPAIMEKSPAIVDKFVSALVRADAALEADAAGAEQAVFANMKGMMPLPALQDMLKEMEFKVQLDQSLPVLLSDEAAWIVDRGMVKADRPTAATFREFIHDAPLKKASPESVKLP